MAIRTNQPRTVQDLLTNMSERLRRLETVTAAQADQIIALQARVTALGG